MIKRTHEMIQQYNNYENQMNKLNREIKKGNLFPIVRGLYETDPNVPGYILSAYIYGPSYLSFEYALSFHGLIPEGVYTYTNATFNKKKSKIYRNHFGTYTYRDIPKEAYPYDIIIYTQNDYIYFMATKEKSLCDMLYSMPPQRSMERIKALIFSDLRIDETEFSHLDFDKISLLCDKYASNNMKLLKKYIRKEYYNDNR